LWIAAWADKLAEKGTAQRRRIPSNEGIRT
jgi:hypothetical protein